MVLERDAEERCSGDEDGVVLDEVKSAEESKGEDEEGEVKEAVGEDTEGK